jgi:uncharacterized membrane protein YccC
MIHATAKSNQDLHSAKIAESVPASFQQSSPTSENEQQFFRGLAKVFLSFSAPADPHIENPSDTLPRISDAGAGQTPDELLGDKSYAGNLYNTRTDITDRLYRLTVQLEGFLASHNLDETCHNESWRGILEALVRTLKDKKMQHSLSTPFWRGVKYRLMFLKDNMGIKHTQTRFALQLAFIVGLAMAANVVLTEFFDAQFAIWIPITAFTVLNTYNDETLKSTLDNAIGTFIGIAVFAFFVHFIPEPYRMPLVVSISYLLILMNIGPTVNVASGTQMALTALYPYTTLGDALISRLVLVVLAVSCVMMIIFVFMRTQRAVTIRTKIQELERIDVRLATHIHKGMKRGRIGLWRSVQLLYYLHMDSWLLDKLVHSLNKDRPEDIQLKEDIDRVLALNYKFAMDAEHAVMLLDPRRSNTNRAGQTDRFAHIDATADRLDTKMHSLEQMHYLGEDADRD